MLCNGVAFVERVFIVAAFAISAVVEHRNFAEVVALPSSSMALNPMVTSSVRSAMVLLQVVRFQHEQHLAISPKIEIGLNPAFRID